MATPIRVKLWRFSSSDSHCCIKNLLRVSDEYEHSLTLPKSHIHVPSVQLRQEYRVPLTTSYCAYPTALADPYKTLCQLSPPGHLYSYLRRLLPTGFRYPCELDTRNFTSILAQRPCQIWKKVQVETLKETLGQIYMHCCWTLSSNSGKSNQFRHTMAVSRVWSLGALNCHQQVRAQCRSACWINTTVRTHKARSNQTKWPRQVSVPGGFLARFDPTASLPWVNSGCTWKRIRHL